MKKYASVGTTVEMVVVKKEVLSPQDYLRANKQQPEAIKSAVFVPPRIGGRGFGAFEVEYRNAKLVPAE